MLGSHNSISYLPIRGWRRVLRPWVRCQDQTLLEQYDNGVRYFDIRIRRKDNAWVFCHNSAIFDDNVRAWSDIFKLAERSGVYFRFILDVRHKPKTGAKDLSVLFWDYIRYLTYERHISIDSAIIMWEWSELLPWRSIKQQEYHASVSAPWYKYLLGTRWFAKRYNKRGRVNLSDYVADACIGKKVLLLDYVQY